MQILSTCLVESIESLIILKSDIIEIDLTLTPLHFFDGCGKCLTFNVNRRYTFLHCQTCGGPLLGNRTETCKQLDGVRYEYIVFRGFEDKIKVKDRFRKIVKKFLEKEEASKSGIKGKEI